MDKSIMLNPSDYVGMSFWIISAAMVAATFFFWVERDRAVGKWKTSLTVAAMVTGIAAIHYFYMREVWIYTGESPTVFRYVDWLLTSILGDFVMTLSVWALWYHALGGIRHLIWDMGYGFDPDTSDKASWGIIIGAFALTFLTIVAIWGA